MRRHSAKRADNEATHSLDSAVDSYLTIQGLGEIKALAQIQSAWNEMVGSGVASHARPRGLKDGELLVAVDHGGWVTELAFQSDRIVNEITKLVGLGVVDRLKVLVESGFGVD